MEVSFEGRKAVSELEAENVEKDILFLIEPGFEDPQFPRLRFFCWHCALLEGVIACFPFLSNLIQIERVSWTRPRDALIRWVGEENQSLPLLLLSDGAKSGLATGSFGDTFFVAGKDAILEALSSRHGLPRPHP